jgi:hypothetical protein
LPKYHRYFRNPFFFVRAAAVRTLFHQQKTKGAILRTYIIAAAILAAAQAAEARSDFNVNVNIGAPPAVVVSPPPPPAPAPPPEVVIETQPSFIFSPTLGFYVSVGIPYDIVYIDRNYYLYSGGSWYVAPSARGPWVVTQRRLPPRLRKFRYEQIRVYRDREYAVYMRDRDHYRGRWHRPEGEWRREQRRDEHRGERREERGENRKEHRGDQRDDFRGERR